MNDLKEFRQSNYEISCAASSYAKKHILLSYTQLSTNQFSEEKENALGNAVGDIRAQIDKRLEDIEIDEYYAQYLLVIANCKKYSIGNCFEFAILALEYVVNLVGDYNAEIFHIDNGDHVF